MYLERRVTSLTNKGSFLNGFCISFSFNWKNGISIRYHVLL
jgi:hypothetical protein